ncbi:bifunctional glutamate--cysteine ligase GshA/glutathione synthetase GshB [Streptococcus equinus]|uniref:bifunctional glutamate--cysteine ligase GshA/glutathione synthetase GshB n=1 Tax=Streptococcus equinus TaxID=1335 RepID=UPI0008827528|nr:bifunctional glutamate--cysteine ligase GshA/glutathione synthetase GshB [Streptococcus equinus]SDQ36706.1 glutamate-cysteine ligase /glutathione synthase [Streptococcus equinus]SEN76534.1 glutamate-cysteine ligase /glutathione synthase [Streptococcus equinus]
MTVNGLLQNTSKYSPILQATFGLERESLRINQENKVAQTNHPDKLGNRSFHPYIQTDYSEAQIELITPIGKTTQDALRTLGAITDVAGRSINQDEYLWPLSMPPKLDKDDIHIAKLDDVWERQYRKHLAESYGKILQSMSGIHYNVELGKDLVATLFEESNYDSLVHFKNDLYLKLAQNFLRYRWLLTYLYGASPIAEEGFLNAPLKQPVRSIRNSHLGYVNHTDIKVSYQSLEHYIADIERYVSSNQLIAEKEFYSAVRLRGSKHVRDYLTNGVTYLELRTFDLNPFDNCGITQETLDTVHLFVLVLLWLDSSSAIDQDITKASKLNDKIALSHPLDKLPEDAPIESILSAMQGIVDYFELSDYYQGLIDAIKNQIEHPEQTIAGRLLDEIDNLSLESFGQKQGQAFHDYAWQAPYALKGYENMELSTQLLMFDAIQKGVHLEILDENDQFIKLWHGDHVEYVKNANMTGKDSYITPLIMENKVVTKKLLSKAGFPVPKGEEFADKAAALRYFSQIKDKAIVVKPKSTNFGLGISIFKESADLTAYQKALDIAFAEDDTILIEEFISGTEYRFFVLDGKCEAVLLRVPANVVGDGKHTIAQLVEMKNQDPLRGHDHRSPLEIIDLGDVEKLMLKQQGYTPEDIPADGVRVDLRRNSNISTGGDSIDVTDIMPDSYKELAAQMAGAVGAWVCGVDLIIPDKTLPASKENPNCACIELNFNPAIYLHTYCHEGPGQALTPKIIAKLFPEI